MIACWSFKLQFLELHSHKPKPQTPTLTIIINGDSRFHIRRFSKFSRRYTLRFHRSSLSNSSVTESMLSETIKNWESGTKSELLFFMQLKLLESRWSFFVQITLLPLGASMNLLRLWTVMKMKGNLFRLYFIRLNLLMLGTREIVMKLRWLNMKRDLDCSRRRSKRGGQLCLEYVLLAATIAETICMFLNLDLLLSS